MQRASCSLRPVVLENPPVVQLVKRTEPNLLCQVELF